MTVQVRWPDGRTEDCYSPSLVMHDHLEVGATYSVADFTARSVRALEEASDRVRARFGFACTSAAATVTQIRTSAGAYAAGDPVAVVSMWPPLPAAPAEPGSPT